MPRTYADPCGLARALNLIGERWALLIVRELLLGPKRFTDLRRGLPAASQSVLTQRLGELERAGVLRRRELGPPVGTQVYELTARGRELEPVLLGLSDWGSRTPVESAGELSVDALALAMKTTFVGRGENLRCEVVLDGDRLAITVTDGRLELVRGELPEPDAVIETTAARFRSLIFAGEKITAGEVTGDRRAAGRLLRMFPRPATA
jgi:DNA-binding HxlR family transcriptional regulator